MSLSEVDIIISKEGEIFGPKILMNQVKRVSEETIKTTETRIAHPPKPDMEKDKKKLHEQGFSKNYFTQNRCANYNKSGLAATLLYIERENNQLQEIVRFARLYATFFSIWTHWVLSFCFQSIISVTKYVIITTLVNNAI